MANLKPWYKVVTPREDLREGKPLDASEFAVHLDQIRDKRAPLDYQNPERFFERTYLTQNLTALAAEVVRRLSGEKTETSAIFNMTTQFGGGKTHSLALLYHLAKNGPDAQQWQGVQKILNKAGVPFIPQAALAVFVGTEFDSLTGRGGTNGEPLRKTPWGEIAYQLGGAEALAVVAEHEKQMTAPSSEVIRRFLPVGQPCLILIDELMNYVNRSRKMGMAAQLYSFLHNLSEEARGQDHVALVVSIPASELEMTADDQAEHERFKKLLDRLGKAVIISSEGETSEIIRRRLFEWHGLPDDAKKTIAEYADWILEHRQQLPNWFPIDYAVDAFSAAYPFHPLVLSVFERKWQALPRFQQTRGILRLLALWVSRTYQEGFKGAHRDPLIGLGTAPLDDPLFRAAAFEQLGETRLEGAVTTDICGSKGAHAIRLDKEAVDVIKKARLHRKVATTIFFESNGGQAKAFATLPEIRLAVAEPDLDIGNIETVLEALAPPDGACFFMDVSKNRYWFSLKPNLTKVLTDRKASVQAPRIGERMKDEIRKVFEGGAGIEKVFFPEKSGQITDQAKLTFIVLGTDRSLQNKETLPFVETMTREYGTTARTFKSALIWVITDNDASLRDEARKVLAWEDIRDEAEELRLDEGQKRQLAENLKKAQRDLKECVWRTYKNIALLDKDNKVLVIDLGLVHSSAADSITTLILNRLRQEGYVEEGISPNFLTRYWPPAFTEWSTKSVRDAFFSSPQFPKLVNAELIKETIAKGVANGILAYVGKIEEGGYEPFRYNCQLPVGEVEFSEDMYLITAKEAKKHIEPRKVSSLAVSPQHVSIEPGKMQTFTIKGLDQHNKEIATDDVTWSATGGKIDAEGVFHAGIDEGSFIVKAKSGEISGSATLIIAKPGTIPKKEEKPTSAGTAKLYWSGEVPTQKWTTFYTKVLAKFAGSKGLKLTIRVEVTPESGVSEQQVNETKIALRELGLSDDVETT